MFFPVRPFTVKEDQMFKKKVLSLLVLISVFLASLTISSFTIQVSPYSRMMAGTFSEQVSLSGSLQGSNPYHLDCFRRSYKFNKNQGVGLNPKDASNYFLNLS
jgi:hypothetical protein